jgi:hypothetical protein
MALRVLRHVERGLRCMSFGVVERLALTMNRNGKFMKIQPKMDIIGVYTALWDSQHKLIRAFLHLSFASQCSE